MTATQHREPLVQPGFTAITSGDPYAAAYTLLKVGFSLLQVEVFNSHHVPAGGPFLIASNHASYLDPPLSGIICYRAMHFFARKSLFRFGFSNKLLRALHSIPVDRDSESDIGAFRQVFTVLKQGGGLTLYPEGTRSADGQLLPVQRGVGMIACRAGVPVVPLRLFGTHKILSRAHTFPRPGCGITAVYGPVLTADQFDPGKDDSDRYGEAANRIMSAIESIPEPAESWV